MSHSDLQTLSKRSSDQGFKPRSRRSKLAALIAVSVLISPFAVQAALAGPGSTSYPVPTTFDSTFVSGLLSARLTAATFQALVNDFGGGYYDTAAAGTNGANFYNSGDLLAMPTTDPLFYSTTTPRYYKFKFCNSNPSNYFIVGNLLVQSGDLRPENKFAWSGTDSVQPTANVTFDLCSQPKTAFAYPSGFVASGSDGNYIFIRPTFPNKIANTTPQDSQIAAYSAYNLAVVLGRTNAQTQVTVPYMQQGTAVYGTDYTGSSNNGVTLTANSITLPTVPSGYSPFGATAPVYFNAANHSQMTLQWSLTAPAGYTFLGASTWNARINAINHSTVTVSAINGQSTITPGSTTGGFVLTRAGGDTSVSLPLAYTIGGTAANGTDYGYLSGNATFPAGQSSLNVPIIAPTPSGSTAIAQKDVLISLSTPADNSYIVPATGATGQSNDFIIPAYNPSTVSFTQGSGGGTLTPGQSQPFTVTRAGGDTTKPLTVNYTTSGSAQQGVDYQPVSGGVTIPAGATTASVPLSAIQHTGTTAFPATTLALTPAAGTGYDATGATPINYSIPAYTPSSVSVSSPSNGGAIPAGGSVPFTVTRTGDTSQPLTIPYTVGGTATQGTDYSQLPGSITIPAGATSATQTITTPTQNGSTAVPSKTITLTPSAGSSYTVDPNNGTATYNTASYTPSSVSPAAGSGGSTIPQGTTGGFTITRTGSTAAALPVTYSLGGTATNGTDYNQLPGSVTIPAGQSSVTVPVTVPAATGSTATPAKSIQVTVNPGTGYAPDATTPSTTLTIPTFTPSGVSFGGATSGMLTPGGTSDGFTVTRAGSTTQPLTVGYTVGGSATPGQDYGQLPGSITIPAGATSATVPLKAFPQSGTAAIPQKDVQITLQPGSGYAPSSSTPADYTIPAYSPNANSNPAVTVSVPTGQNTILQPGTSTNGFTVTRSGVTTSPLPINYTVGGTGTAGTDYSPLSGTVTIPAGASSATVPISVPSGATVGKTVAIGVTPGSGYSQGTNSNVTYTIGNLATTPNVPTIGLGFDPTVPAFVVTRTGGDTTQPLTVPVNFGGSGVPDVDYSTLPTSVTFGAGKTTAQVPVKLLSTATTGDTITASIPDGAGYTVGSGNGTAFTVPAGYNDGSNLAKTPATPATTSAKKKAGSSSVTGFAAGAAGLGSIALGSGVLGSGAGAAAAGASALAVPGLLAGSTFGLIPQSCSTTGETPLQLAQLLPQLKDAQPNWSAASFGSLPAPTQAGSIKLGNQSRSWKAGQPVADIVHVEDTDGTFNLHCMGLSKLASLGQMGIAAKPLSALNLVVDTTLQGLSKTLYLRAKKVGDVKGMAELLAAKSGGVMTVEQVSGMSFADVVKANPDLGKLPMGAMPLNQLPGYNDMLVGDVPNWKSGAVSQIVGLKNIPFSQFPAQPKPLSASAK